MHLLLLVFALVALVGTAVVLYLGQRGKIESRKIMIGATVVLLISGAAVIVLALQDSAARAEAIAARY